MPNKTSKMKRSTSHQQKLQQLLQAIKAHRFSYVFFKWLVIPGILLGLGLLLALSLNSSGPISIATYPQTHKDNIKPIEKPLMKGEKITGKFVAQSNNLGVLSIRFGTYKRAGNDILVFRIKENVEKNWYYQANYKVDQFQDNQLFTFGFPVVTNSKSKTYDFEIESTLGKKNDAVYVSPDQPIFITSYKYSIKYAATNIIDTANFLQKKAINPSAHLKDSLQQLLILTPLIFYLFFALFNNKLGAKIYYGCFSIFVILIASSAEFNSLVLQDFRIFGIFWVMSVVIYRLRSEATFFVAGILICLSLISSVFGNNYYGEKIAIFVYWLLLAAMIELSFEVVTRMKFKRGYKEFLKLIII
ncbi:MAG: hypothetical protein HZC02_02200 [Candidatus Levybacteria bacterium]|nr:hypothetical protein [Candidatus Levybacteria bacterium]